MTRTNYLVENGQDTRNWNKSDSYLISHYTDVIMGTIASQITSVSIAYLTVSTGADQRKHQSSASLAFVRGIHREPVNSPHKWPVTRKMFPFDDVIMQSAGATCSHLCCKHPFLFLSSLLMTRFLSSFAILQQIVTLTKYLLLKNCLMLQG